MDRDGTNAGYDLALTREVAEAVSVPVIGLVKRSYEGFLPYITPSGRELAEIAAAIKYFNRKQSVDVILLVRGGGSLEDLWAFNEEVVVRAVASCRVPVVSAVGHDVDVTLVDFAADARAATPSQAAEMAVPDRAAYAELLRRTRLHLTRAMRGRLTEDRVSFVHAARRLGDPRLAIAAHQQSLDEREARLTAWVRTTV